MDSLSSTGPPAVVARLAAIAAHARSSKKADVQSCVLAERLTTPSDLMKHEDRQPTGRLQVHPIPPVNVTSRHCRVLMAELLICHVGTSTLVRWLTALHLTALASCTVSYRRALQQLPELASRPRVCADELLLSCCKAHVFPRLCMSAAAVADSQANDYALVR
jgi:hypothetical protein